MYVMILGAPGSGKGTQGKLLAAQLGIPQVSTGDLLRAAVKDGTPLGKQAKGYMDQGLLVPDEIIIGLIREILDSDAGRGGVLMDGFPRTVPQAEAVDRILAGKHARVDHVALLEVDEQELVRRLLDRRASSVQFVRARPGDRDATGRPRPVPPPEADRPQEDLHDALLRRFRGQADGPSPLRLPHPPRRVGRPGQAPSARHRCRAPDCARDPRNRGFPAQGDQGRYLLGTYAWHRRPH